MNLITPETVGLVTGEPSMGDLLGQMAQYIGQQLGADAMILIRVEAGTPVVGVATSPEAVVSSIAWRDTCMGLLEELIIPDDAEEGAEDAEEPSGEA